MQNFFLRLMLFLFCIRNDRSFWMHIIRSILFCSNFDMCAIFEQKKIWKSREGRLLINDIILR